MECNRVPYVEVLRAHSLEARLVVAHALFVAQLHEAINGRRGERRGRGRCISHVAAEERVGALDREALTRDVVTRVHVAQGVTHSGPARFVLHLAPRCTSRVGLRAVQPR